MTPTFNANTAFLATAGKLRARNRIVAGLLLVLLGQLLSVAQTAAQPEHEFSAAARKELQTLTSERELLTSELKQYQTTLSLLHTGSSPAIQSSNATVRKLAAEVISMKRRLIGITEREITLLQSQIDSARAQAQVQAQAAAENSAPGESTADATPAVNTTEYLRHAEALASEQEAVNRLRRLLEQYYAELEREAAINPTPEELAQRKAAEEDARKLEDTPFSADQVLLNGLQGSTALGQMTRRLANPNIPEARRDIAPICSIRTHLFGSLVGSESRSLRPVGKNNYVARIHLQPGDTALRVQGRRWELSLPKGSASGDFLVTFYRPPEGRPELHVFPVAEFTDSEDAHIPAWLPDQLNIKPSAG